MRTIAFELDLNLSLTLSPANLGQMTNDFSEPSVFNNKMKGYHLAQCSPERIHVCIGRFQAILVGSCRGLKARRKIFPRCIIFEVMSENYGERK